MVSGSTIGNNYLALKEDLCSWATADTVAQITKPKFEQGGLAEFRRNYLEGRCTEWFCTYLEREGHAALHRPSKDPCDPSPRL